MNFLDKATAREQTDESRTKEKESALFEGPIGNITGRYDFEIPFNFSDSSESENKGKSKGAKRPRMIIPQSGLGFWVLRPCRTPWTN